MFVAGQQSHAFSGGLVANHFMPCHLPFAGTNAAQVGFRVRLIQTHIHIHTQLPNVNDHQRPSSMANFKRMVEPCFGFILHVSCFARIHCTNLDFTWWKGILHFCVFRVFDAVKAAAASAIAAQNRRLDGLSTAARIVVRTYMYVDSFIRSFNSFAHGDKDRSIWKIFMLNALGFPLDDSNPKWTNG